MKKPGLGYRPHFDLVTHPRGARLCEMPLVQSVRQRQAVVNQDIGGSVFALGIDGLDESRFAEKESDFAQVI